MTIRKYSDKADVIDDVGTSQVNDKRVGCLTSFGFDGSMVYGNNISQNLKECGALFNFGYCLHKERTGEQDNESPVPI